MADSATFVHQKYPSTPEVIAGRKVETLEWSPLRVFRHFGCTGPLCHAGSLLNGKHQITAAEIRATFAEFGEFVGVDLFAGPNVDVVADLGEPLPADLVGRFGIVWAGALLEHVPNPFKVAANLQAMLRPGGHVFYCGPWVQAFHSYPNDYWRISIEGLKVLFPEVEWSDWWYSSSQDKRGIRLRSAQHEGNVFRFYPEVQGAGATLTDRVMPYLNIVAIGQKR
jgi:hypothetical protein